MTPTTQIAVHVFRESVRDRVPHALVVFAVLMIGASVVIGQLTAGQDVKIIKDLGLAASRLFGLLIAVFIGISLVSKEVERRSIYTLLAKPVRRHEVILGKYLGLCWTLAVNLAVMATAHYVLLAYMSATESEEFKRSWEAPAVDPALLSAYLLIVVELMVVTAIAMLFSTFSSPMLSATLALALYVVGHLNSDLRTLEAAIGPSLIASLARILSYALPNLELFDISADVVHGQSVPALYLVLSVSYGLIYVALLLTGAMFIFSRRDFT